AEGGAADGAGGPLGEGRAAGADGGGLGPGAAAGGDGGADRRGDPGLGPGVRPSDAGRRPLAGALRAGGPRPGAGPAAGAAGRAARGALRGALRGAAGSAVEPLMLLGRRKVRIETERMLLRL